MILHLYFTRKFLVWFGIVFGIFFGIILLIDVVEQIRRFDAAAVGLSEAFRLALLNAPQSLYRILPLLVILSTLGLFLGLARSSELVVTRAAGRSALRSLVAPVIMALILGGLAVSIWNPIVAGTSRAYEQYAQRLTQGEENVVSIGKDGLWLRQATREGQTVIRAAGSNGDGTALTDVTVLAFDTASRPVFRAEADAATLTPGAWVLTSVKRWDFTTGGNVERDAQVLDRLEVASNLTRDDLRESFGAPSAIPIWDLPDFITRLEAAGFSSTQHRVWMWTEISTPLMLVAMVLIAAGFTMRHTRFGKTGTMVLFALLLGFGIFFLRNFAQVLGENGQIPVLLAAWAPPVTGILLSVGLLLHTEDG
jgi:lipopolysaccharide export system permease protein